LKRPPPSRESHARAPLPPAPEAGPLGAAVPLALTCLVALRIVACFVPSGWVWGLDTFRHLPPFAMAGLMAVALAGLVPAAARAIERALDRAGRAWDRRPWAGDLLLAAGVFLLCLLLRDPLRFTGDSLMRAGLPTMTVAGAARIMNYGFPLDDLVNVAIPRWLAQQGMASATALQLVGAAMGAAYALAASALVRAAGARGAARVAGALAALGAGTLVHFAGYDKFGPFMLGIALAMLGAIRLAREGTGHVALAAGSALAFFSHRSAFCIVPALAWVLVRAWGAARTRPARTALAATAVAAGLAAAVMLPRAVDVLRRIDSTVHLPGGSEAASREATGVASAVTRAVQVTSVTTFVAPLWLAGLVAAVALGRRGGRRARSPNSGFTLGVPAALGLFGFAAVVLSISPGGGWPRDWDAALPLGAFVSLATAAALATWWSREAGPPRGVAAAAALALATAAALWSVHASEAVALRRVDFLLAEPAMWSPFTRANAYDILGATQANAGRFERSAAYFERAIEVAPNPRYFHQLGLVRLAMGQPGPARAQFTESLKRNSVPSDAWVGLARVALAEGDRAAAIAFADSALARSPGRRDALEVRRAAGGP